jgi:hypothetical protein
MITSRGLEWQRCSTHGQKRNACKVYMGKPEGITPPGGLMRRWEDNVRKDLEEMMWDNIGFVWLGIGPVEG